MQLDAQITANYGLDYEQKEETILRNNVIVITKKKEKIETEELIRNKRTGEVYTDKFVKITTKDKIIFAQGLKTNADLSQYQLYNIKGEILLN